MGSLCLVYLAGKHEFIVLSLPCWKAWEGFLVKPICLGKHVWVLPTFACCRMLFPLGMQPRHVKKRDRQNVEAGIKRGLRADTFHVPLAVSCWYGTETCQPKGFSEGTFLQTKLTSHHGS